MATPTKRRLQDEIRRELQSQGVSVRLLDSWPAKATYYKPDGEALPNLPADPWSMKRYLARGLSLEPPRQSVEAAPPPVAEGAPADDLTCDVCGKGPFKSKSGLQGHMRWIHKR